MFKFFLTFLLFARMSSSVLQLCENKNRSCNAWAVLGYCDNFDYKPFMKENCRKRCGYCVEEEPQICTSSDSLRCVELAGKGYCDDGNKDLMKKNCPEICGHCVYDVPTLCVDFDEECMFEVTQEECSKSKFAQLNCCESCRRLSFEIDTFTGVCGRASWKAPSVRIAGGTEAKYGSIPWQVYLPVDSESETTFCGGVLISRSHVLTAAHCVRHPTVDRNNFYLHLGSNRQDAADTGEKIIKAKDITTHPYYNHTWAKNDIALITMEKEVEMSEFIRPICLPLSNDGDEAVKAVVSGWGLDRDGDASSSLEKLEVDIIPNEECNLLLSKYPEDVPVTSDMICAVNLESNGTDACEGDSGGPLTVNYDDQHFLIGLVSWGYGCGEWDSPGVYTKVFNYLEWIIVHMRYI